MENVDNLGIGVVAGFALAYRYFQPGAAIVRHVVGEIHPDEGSFTAWCAPGGVATVGEAVDHAAWANPVAFATFEEAAAYMARALAELEPLHIVIEDQEGKIYFDSLVDCEGGRWFCIRQGAVPEIGLGITRHYTADEAAMAGMAYQARSLLLDCRNVAFRIEETPSSFQTSPP